jgi:Leucine-rich repeat (LRR) protein
MIKGNFNELYANQTMLTDVIRLNEYKDLKVVQLNGNSITTLPKLNHRNLTQIQFQDNLLTSID